MIKKIFAILFLLMLVASAGDWQLPDTYVRGGLNVKNTTALNATTVTTLTASSTTDLNGAATTRDITLDANKNISLSGTGTISGAASVSATSILGNVTGLGTLQGEQLTSTDDARIADTTTTNALLVNTTATVTGKLATGLAPTYTHQDWSYALSMSANADKTIYLVGNASANHTIVLDTVAASAGKSYTFVTVTDPGSYYFILDGSGAETINGQANIASTAQYDAITVYCDGVAWFITNKIGTWVAVIP